MTAEHSAGILPVVITLIDSPSKALVVVIAILLYQQVENYIFAPRIPARTMRGDCLFHLATDLARDGDGP